MAQPPSLTLRLFQLLAQLNSMRGKALSKHALAERLEVNEKTIRRWTRAWSELVDYNLPNLPMALPRLSMEKREGLAYVVMERAQPTPGEVFQYAAVHAAVSHLTALEDAVLGASAEAALTQLGASADEDLVRKVKQSFYYRPLAPKRYDEEALDILDDAITALMYRHPLTITYRALSAETGKSHHYEPYTLVMFRDGFYLLGRTAKGLMLVAIDRLEDVELDRETTFDVPDDFDPKAHFSGSFGLWVVDDPSRIQEIRLAFDPSVARTAAERSWPGFVRWEDHPDGRHVLILHLAVTPDVVTWILNWQFHVEVLHPRSLRDTVMRSLEKTLVAYR